MIAEPEDSKNAQELVKEINDYITKTNGAVEYAVIKDKTERRIDSLYEFATSKISFPTYLGLMGTFFGVYIGLKCFNAGLGQGNGGITDQMVKELIGGIIVSMVTSLVGLVLMTISNIHASNVQKKVDTQKDEFFEFLQMSVIPTLGTNVSSSLNRLRSTIGNFEPSFRAVIEEFKAAFRDCTDMFKGTFAENAEVLTKAVAEMGSNMTLINENIQKQDQLLTTLRQRDMVTTLDKFVTAANSFDSVTTSIQKLEEAKEAGERTGVICTDETRGLYRADCVKSAGSRRDEDEIARELFRILREFDDEKCTVMYSESFRDQEIGDVSGKTAAQGGFGMAIMNRLMKAAGQKIIQV